MAIIKEGFLLKRDDSFMFPGWKKKHIMIKNDGEVLIGDGKHVQHKFNTRIDMKKIDVGFEAPSANLPKGQSNVEAMFVVTTKHKTYYLLSGSPGECSEWIGALRNSKTAAPTARAPAMEPSLPPYPTSTYQH